MQFQDTKDPPAPAPTIPEFTVKPTGEVSIKGSPDPLVIQQIMASSDYQQEQTRRYKLDIERQSKQVDLMVIGFLGCTFLIAIFCLFLTLNNGNKHDSESIRGISCGQVR